MLAAVPFKDCRILAGPHAEKPADTATRVRDKLKR
jgi:hypothetical protein